MEIHFEIVLGIQTQRKCWQILVSATFINRNVSTPIYKMGFCIVIPTEGFTNRLWSPTGRLCLEGEEAGYRTLWHLEPISQSESCTLRRCSKHVLAGWTRSEYLLYSTRSSILFQWILKKEPTWVWYQTDFDLRACFPMLCKNEMSMISEALFTPSLHGEIIHTLKQAL